MAQTSSDTLDATFARAKTSLKISTASADSKRAKRSSFIGSAVSAIDGQSGNPTIQALEPVVTETISVVQSQLDGLAMASQALVGALDELSKLHPFVTVVVTAFKVAWKFEVTRRQNDKRVQMVNLKMNEMLETLLLLRNIAQDDRGKDGTLIAQRLNMRMQTIAHDIESCAAVCDTFSKKRTVVKLFKSLTWEQKLLGFIDQFIAHKETLQFDLAMHASIGIEQANMTLIGISGHAKKTDSKVSTLLLLQLLRSPKDRQLLTKIELKGGAEEALQDENFMKELIAESGEKDLQGETDAPSKDKQAEAMKTILRDIGRTIDDMVKENEEIFTRKFKAQELVLKEEMAVITRREGDRVIAAITSGPYERILDPHIYAVWKESGWKGTAKARNLVMALREHYAEHLKAITSTDHLTLDKIGEILSPSEAVSTKTGETEEVSAYGVHPDDEWALQYISISRIQPLLEAIDDDASSLVSISEVNAFTAARPKNWSLPHWIAYWTAGHPLVLKYYFTRIQLLMSRLTMIAGELHSTNRPINDYFSTDWIATCSLDTFLAGVHDAVKDLQDDDELFKKFKDYVIEEETKMKEKLQAVLYYIDAPNTLDIVTNSGRLEKHVMPLIYLLLLRALHVLRHGREVALHPKELTNIVESFGTIWNAISTRVLDFEAVSKLQNLSAKEQFRKFSYGIYYYVKFEDEVKSSQYWKQVYWYPSGDVYNYYGLNYFCNNFLVSQITYEDLSLCNEDVTEDLLYDPPDDSLHLEIYDEVEDADKGPVLGGSDGQASTWSGVHVLKQNDGTFADTISAGIFRLELPGSGENGVVTGTGTSSSGDFTVLGTLNDGNVVYNKHYPLLNGLMFRFQGTLNAERDALRGVWGIPSTNVDKENLTISLTDEEILGRFDYRIAPTRFGFIQIDEAEQATNKARALWKFAITTVLNLVKIRAGHFSWQYLSERRRMRKRFIDLWSRVEDSTSSWPYVMSMLALTQEECEELAGLVAMLSDRDLRFYKNLCVVLQRRRVIHWRYGCDGPDCTTGGGDFNTTRYACLDCMSFDPETGEEPNTMDFCVACIDKPRDRDHNKHIPTHALLQSREAEQSKVQYCQHKAVHNMLQRLREEDKPDEPRCCASCKEKVQSPYWVCFVCSLQKKTDVFMCMSCKEKKEKFYSPIFDLSFARRKTGKAMPPKVPVTTSESTDTAQVDNSADADKVAEEQPSSTEDAQSNADSDEGVKSEKDSVPPSDAAPTDEQVQSPSASPPDIVVIEEDGGALNAQPTSAEHESSEDASVATPTEAGNTSTETPPIEDLLAGHAYQHVLILYRPAPEVEPEVVPTDAMTEKLETMHEHMMTLQNRVASFEARMDRLEELLCRALGIPRDNAEAAAAPPEETVTTTRNLG